MIVTLPIQCQELRPSLQALQQPTSRLSCKWSSRITSLEFYNKNLINTQPKNIYGSFIYISAPSWGARRAQQQTPGEKQMRFCFPDFHYPESFSSLASLYRIYRFWAKHKLYKEPCLLIYNPVYFTNCFFFSPVFYPFSLGVFVSMNNLISSIY